MKGFRKLLFLLILFGSVVVKAQDDVAKPGRNPERRGIRLLNEDRVRALSTPRKKGPGYALDPRKSIFVTDIAILQRFTFDEVMERLASAGKSKKLTKEQLFQQWWDSANTKALFSLPFGGPNCDSGVLNTFPYTCPRNEGQQVTSNVFGATTPVTYTAIALSNRFDLATPPEKGGTDCGEYRIVFERNSGGTNPLDRNLIIFEAVVPNPHKSAKSLKGCRDIQETWERLSQPGLPVAKRADMLHDFYFKGKLLHGSMKPVVLAEHYGSSTPAAEGQIRTNQFMAGANPQSWMLRQFHTVVDPQQGLKIIPVPDATNAPASLFADGTQPPIPAFQAQFLTQIPSLAATAGNCNLPNPLDCISMETLLEDDNGESIEGGINIPPTAMNYAGTFVNSKTFRGNIQNKLTAMGSALTPDNIVARAQTQTCAGCHQLSSNADLGGGLTWPASLGFTQERLAKPFDTTGSDGPRYEISPALTNFFLPARRKVICEFLEGQIPVASQTCLSAN